MSLTLRSVTVVMAMAIAAALLFVSGCGGEGGGSASPIAPGSTRAMAVTGLVYTGANVPLEGVTVATTDGVYTYRAVSNADGRYTLPALPAGQRVLTYSKPGFHAEFKQIQSAGDSTLTVNTGLREDEGLPTEKPILEITANHNVAKGTVALSGVIRNVDTPLLSIEVNGQEELQSINSDGTTGSFSHTVVLRPGSNRVQVRAANNQGYCCDIPRLFNYNPSSPVVARVTLTWSGKGDVDLHMWDPLFLHNYYDRQGTPSSELDVDNTEGFGPENITLFGNGRFGRFRFAVNAYGLPNNEPVDAFVKVVVSSGPNQGTYTFGPYSLRGSGGGEDYPVTIDNLTWWRAFDLTLDANGTVTIIPPDSTELVE